MFVLETTRNNKKGGRKREKGRGRLTFRGNFRENLDENRVGTGKIFIDPRYRGRVKITSFVVGSGVNNVGDKVYEKQRQRHLSPTGYEIGDLAECIPAAFKRN